MAFDQTNILAGWDQTKKPYSDQKYDQTKLGKQSI